jgi:hypothetical protein
LFVRVLKALCVALVAFIGVVVMASSGTQSGGGRLVMALVGLAVLAAAAAAAVTWFPRARRPEAYVSSAGDAVTVSLRGRRQVPVVVMLMLLVVVLAVATFAVDNAGRWVFAAMALVLLLPVPDMVRGVLRQPALRIDAAGVQLRGPAQDVEIAWSDVLDVSQTNVNAQTPVIRVRGREGAASYSHTKRGLLFGRQPAHPGLDVPSILVDDPYGIYVILNGLAMARVDERSGMVASVPELLEDRANGIRPENEPRR